MITKKEVQYTFPDVAFWFDDKPQFIIDNDLELNNIRTLALQRDCIDKVKFIFEKDSIIHVITIDENGDLSDWPRGMYDATMIQLSGMFGYRRTKDKSKLKIVNS